VVYPLPFFGAILANFLLFFSFQMLLAPFPIYVQSIGGTPSQLGLVVGILALTAVLSRPFAGWLADHKGRRIGLIAGAAIFILSHLLYSIARDVGWVIPIRLLHGVGLALFTTSYIAFIADMAPPSRRGEAFGLAGLASPIALLFSPLLGAWIAGEEEFTRLFLASAFVSAISLAVAASLPESLKYAQDPKPSAGFWQVLRWPEVWVPTLVTVMVAITYGAIISFLPVFVREKGAGNPGLFFSAFAVTILLTQVGAGRLSDIFGRRKVAIPATLILGLSLALISRLASTGDMLLAAAVYGLGYGATRTSVDALIIDGVAQDVRGTAMGIEYAGFDIGVGLGSFILGIVADVWGYQTMYLTIAFICVLIGATFALLSRRLPVTGDRESHEG